MACSPIREFLMLNAKKNFAAIILAADVEYFKRDTNLMILIHEINCNIKRANHI